MTNRRSLLFFVWALSFLAFGVIFFLSIHEDSVDFQAGDIDIVTDYARWGSSKHFSGRWARRSKFAVKKLLPNDVSTVLDIGCSPKFPVKLALPSHVKYVPSDLFKHDEYTIVLNFNSPILPTVNPLDNYRSFVASASSRFGENAMIMPEVEKIDCIIMLGVLEYIYDIPRAVRFLHQFGKGTRLILSYSDMDKFPPSLREELGWVSACNDAEIKAAFTESGLFTLVQQVEFPEQHQWLYLFEAN